MLPSVFYVLLFDFKRNLSCKVGLLGMCEIGEILPWYKLDGMHFELKLST